VPTYIVLVLVVVLVLGNFRLRPVAQAPGSFVGQAGRLRQAGRPRIRSGPRPNLVGRGSRKAARFIGDNQSIQFDWAVLVDKRADLSDIAFRP
jgi:hypothetical protein